MVFGRLAAGFAVKPGARAASQRNCDDPVAPRFGPVDLKLRVRGYREDYDIRDRSALC